MFRIDDASAATSLPAPEAARAEGYWTEGNPGSGVPATLVRASWLNMIQEELRNVVVAAGLTPSKTTYNQLLSAIQALIPGAFVYLTATGGYIKFPGTNAPVLQWGTSSCLASQTTPVTFAPAFTNACLAVIGTGYNVAGSLQAYVTMNGWSKTGFTYNAFYANSGSAPALCAQAGGVNCIWLAIGY